MPPPNNSTFYLYVFFERYIVLCLSYKTKPQKQSAWYMVSVKEYLLSAH